MADRFNFEGESKDRGIQVAQQTIRNRGFLFEQLLEFPHIDFATRYHLEQPHVMQAAGGNFAARDEFGAAEEISLEIGVAHVASLLKLVGRLDFLRQHFAFW